MRISIVIPSYNQNQYINKTLESIFTQEGDFSIECFVMDGGSTDGTVNTLKKFEKDISFGKYSNYNNEIRFKWQSRKDKGQSDAINNGLKKTTGDILAYLNSDDYYDPGCFKKVISKFRKNNDKLWLTGYCRLVNEDGEAIQSIIEKYKIFWLNHYSYNKLLSLNFISQPATFWRKEILDKFGLFDEGLRYTMDYDYWLRIGKTTDPIILNDFIADFRIHSASKGGSQFIKQFDEDFLVVKLYSNNKFILLTHNLHNLLIKAIYRIIK